MATLFSSLAPAGLCARGRPSTCSTECLRGYAVPIRGLCIHGLHQFTPSAACPCVPASDRGLVAYEGDRDLGGLAQWQATIVYPARLPILGTGCVYKLYAFCVISMGCFHFSACHLFIILFHPGYFSISKQSVCAILVGKDSSTPVN